MLSYLLSDSNLTFWLIVRTNYNIKHKINDLACKKFKLYKNVGEFAQNIISYHQYNPYIMPLVMDVGTCFWWYIYEAISMELFCTSLFKSCMIKTSQRELLWMCIVMFNSMLKAWIHIISLLVDLTLPIIRLDHLLVDLTLPISRLDSCY